MTLNAQLIAAIVSATFSVILTGIVTLIAWKGKGILRDHGKNTDFRKFMLGQAIERDDGELEEINDRFDELRAERKEEHREVQERLDEIEDGMAYVTQFVRNIAGALNRSDIDDIVEEPTDPEPPDVWADDRTGNPNND